MKKRILSFMLSLILVLSLIPKVNVYAAETISIIIEASETEVKPGATIDFTVKLGPVVDFGGIQLGVDLPEGLSTVSSKVNRALQDDMGDPLMFKFTDRLNVVQANDFYIIIAGLDSGFTSAEEKTLFTFTCKAADDFGGEAQLTLAQNTKAVTQSNVEYAAYDVKIPSVYVGEPVTGLTIDPAVMELDTAGQTETITATVIPANASNKKVSFTSSDESVASVDEDGRVTAVANGTATITVKTESGDFTKECKVTVNIVHKHELIAHEAVEATTESAGNIAYWECSACGELFSDAEGKNKITLVDTVIPKIKKAQEALKIEDAGAKTYGDAEFALNVTGGSGTGAVTLASSDETIASTSGTSVKILKAGEVTITATKAGDDDYKDATAEYVLKIAKKALTVTPENKTVTRGGKLPEFTCTTDGLEDGDTYTEAVFETTAKDTATIGDYKITVSGGKLSNESYDITYGEGTLTVKEKEAQAKLEIAETGEKTYGDEAFHLTTTGGSGSGDVTYESSDPTVVSISGDLATILKAGTVTITATKAEDDDYLKTTASCELTVARKELIVTAVSRTMGVGGSVPKLTYTVSGFVGNDSFLTEPELSTDATADSEIGTYDITIEGGTLSNPDSYTVKYVKGVLTVNVKLEQDALSISDVGTKTYGDAAFALTTVGGSGSGEVTYESSNPEIASIEDGKLVIHKVGTVTITAVKAEDDEYNETSATLEITIGKKVLTVTADHKSIVMGNALPTLTYTVSGLVDGDTFEGAKLATTAEDSSAVGTYEITVEGGELTNEDCYTVNYVNGTLTINALPVAEPDPGITDPGTSDPTTPGTETKPDGTVVETTTETTSDGGVKEVTTETKTDGTKTETTTKTDADGTVTSVKTKTELPAEDEATSVTVTVKKDADGNVTTSKATATSTVGSDNKATISVEMVSKVIDAAGTESVAVTVTVKDSIGNVQYKVKADAESLMAGTAMYIYKLDKKTGDLVMVDDKTYAADSDGRIDVSMDAKGTYELVSEQEAKRINQEIKASITPKKKEKSVSESKTVKFALDNAVNKDNIKTIVYTSKNQGVVTVDANGKITGKKKGTAKVKAKVTLKNGMTKTIKMKVNVK